MKPAKSFHVLFEFSDNPANKRFVQLLQYTLYFEDQGVCRVFSKDQLTNEFCGNKTNLSPMSVVNALQYINLFSPNFVLGSNSIKDTFKTLRSRYLCPVHRGAY